MDKPIETLSGLPQGDAPHLIRSANWLGVKTLYYREVWRFLKVWNQTMMAPVITTLLWLAILTLALGGNRGGGVDMPFNQFVVPGLIMMAVMQNAFANTSSSLMMAKIQGTIVDILMPPLTPDEITLSMAAGGVTRGVLVGLVTAVAAAFFVHIALPHPLIALFYLLNASLMLALLGLLAGIFAQGFDQMNALTNYVITPLSFLSGTFYSVNALPEFWHALCYYNPFFYLMDGFRYALTGHNDAPLSHGMITIVVLNVLLWLGARAMVKSGWRLKS
ncbi:MAG: multidrug ABC transporter permease [Alphaproteobacteria bacterium]|nr:multidrug ABC transporter permease [Alphaproteobacteria bacterium]